MAGEVRFIGVVESVVGDESIIQIYPEYEAGLFRLEEYSRLWILYWFHERDDLHHRSVLRVVPRRHGDTEPCGVFASHSPSRPNPIGLTAVDLLKIDENRLNVRGLDALKGSPVIDIKPCGI
jgi:tRNA-Thr(GGU) m(6)t(6)A37 methyltransferase TsaA